MKVQPNHELTFVCSTFSLHSMCLVPHLFHIICKEGLEQTTEQRIPMLKTHTHTHNFYVWYHCYSAQSEYLNHCANREWLDKVNTPIDTAPYGYRDNNRSVVDTLTSALVLLLLLQQPQVNKLAGPPGVQA